MERTIGLRPLTPEAFAGFGEVIDRDEAKAFAINNGLCRRYHDLAVIETAGEGARPLISIIRGEPYALPLRLPLVERHPLGSQAFVPLSANRFVVVVAADRDGVPERPLAFLTAPGQGVNIARNVWHGILTPLDGVSEFVVVDRGGEGVNLEEHVFEAPYEVA